ncbi:SUZ domain-containing protein 1-like [Lingula anatina]|uniref:SUZ RNA-binding domain-containing n=1 Tax=Lingula anatina TaxID=7574 RepID=A0A1S3H8Z0_LINAN|nr:SUZ domain-containing protein 1-like [Lingula anatina]|eukprot:XP_013381589.1 SUZ domain-containing protein 1-like [Lingula anatina]
MAEEEDVLDSWEDLGDNEEAIDKKIEKMKTKIKADESIRNRDADDFTIPKLEEDTVRTQYQPAVRILKRNPNPAETQANGSANRDAKPMKTLEQREAEYAEVRARIFGTDGGSGDGEPSTVELERAPRLLEHQMNNVRLSDNVVLRQPKGPDGTKGFGSKT